MSTTQPDSIESLDVIVTQLEAEMVRLIEGVELLAKGYEPVNPKLAKRMCKGIKMIRRIKA